MTNSWQRWKGIMKCYPFEESRLAKWSPPYIVQPKYDGDRCKSYPVTYADGANNYIMLSSEENPFFLMHHIKESLNKSGLNIPLDGELYSHQLYLEGGHELIHSIVSRSVNQHPRYKEIQLHLFDLEVPEFQIKRLLMLNDIKKMNLPHIVVAPYWICESLSDIKKVYDNLINQNYEGIIIRNFTNIYERKRSTMMMKFKPKREDTYSIVGYNEEISKDGIPKGRLGSLILSSQAGDTFSVSAGLNDEERNRLWSIRGLLHGVNVIVHYQHLTQSGIPKGCFDMKVLI